MIRYEKGPGTTFEYRILCDTGDGNVMQAVGPGAERDTKAEAEWYAGIVLDSAIRSGRPGRYYVEMREITYDAWIEEPTVEPIPMPDDVVGP